MKHIKLTPAEALALQITEDLNKPRAEGIKVGLTTRLHQGQIDILRPLYRGAKRTLFVPCGRKFGKTEVAAYALWKQALLVPGSACYYVAPEGNHGRKIVWDTQRLQNFLYEDTDKYVIRKKIRNNEMMLPFKNGSFIQVIGSENYAAANGLTPYIAVYDEFKAFHPRWHIDFAPNRAAKAAPLIVIGTLPAPGDKNADQYFEMLEHAKKDPKSAVFIKTTFDNPINHQEAQKEAIEAEIRNLKLRGEEDVVQREYYSRIVPGGKKAIFPMLNKAQHMRPHHVIMEEIKRDLKKLEWYLITDPGTTTVFAGLVVAVNPFSKKVYVLDELYETDQSKTSTRMIYPLLEQKMKKYYPGSSIHDDWLKGYDEAAAWFSNEVMHQYGVYFTPVPKYGVDKEKGLSLIKDQLIHDFMVISDNCPKLWWEMENYAHDSKGNIPKKRDHAIDCLRYFNILSNYNMIEALEFRKNPDPLEKDRYRSIGHEPLDDMDDWTLLASDYDI